MKDFIDYDGLHMLYHPINRYIKYNSFTVNGFEYFKLHDIKKRQRTR